jgi:diguanylate cyclase (GGDEF)-like protein/PAS domain S-box-containing protein
MSDISAESVTNIGTIDSVVWHEAHLVLLQLNPANTVVSCNPYARQLTGMDLTGMQLDKVFLNFSPDPTLLDVPAMTASKSQTRFLIPTVTGIAANLIFRFIATPSDQVLAIGWHDMPEVTHLQQQLIDLNNELNYVTRAALKDSQFEIERQTAKHRLILESAGEGICSLDTEGRPSFVNPAAAATLGYSPEELIGKSGHAVWHGLHADGRPYNEQESLIQQTLAHGTSHTSDSDYFQHKDGELLPVTFTSSPIIEHRRVVGAVLTFRDITERKQTEVALRLSASVFANSIEGVIITDADNVIIDVNPAFSNITGYNHDEALGQNPCMLGSGRQGPEFYTRMWDSLREHDFWQGELWNRRKNGDCYAQMLSISVVRDNSGQLQHYIGVFSDITNLKKHEAELNRIAHYDTLTGVPNRRLLADRLEQAIVCSRRNGKTMAICYLDLDGFKIVNDHHGHEAGDQLLIAVASRMKDALRKGDTLARVGGDEFVAVLLDLADVADSLPMLSRLLAAADQPVHIGDLVFQVSASIGVTFYPQTEDADADLLLRQADQAMYQAKLAGKNRYHVFDAELDRSVRGHHESLERIRRALIAREFVLYYQPKVNMRTGEVIGAEALIRWQHPECGLLAPAEFLPVIENHPLSVEIGEWVIDTALTQVAAWQTDGLNIPVSVNVSARQLQQADFVERLREILAQHPDVMPSCLELEVLETSALEELVRVSEVIESCRKIGVMFALDDFGTGYSSLTYLKRLAVAQLKIDQSFVCNMLNDPSDLAILEGVLGLAAAFHRQVIAEGVETVEHGILLLQLGCVRAQGYGIARPMPAADLPAWAATWKPDPAWVDLPAIRQENLPALVASVKHRAWIIAFEAFLTGLRVTPPPLDHRQCCFGIWLNAEGMDSHGTQPVFKEIKQVHYQMHDLATEIMDLHTAGRNPEALTKVVELRSLRDDLLEQLKPLVQ